MMAMATTMGGNYVFVVVCAGALSPETGKRPLKVVMNTLKVTMHPERWVYWAKT